MEMYKRFGDFSTDYIIHKCRNAKPAVCIFLFFCLIIVVSWVNMLVHRTMDAIGYALMITLLFGGSMLYLFQYVKEPFAESFEVNDNSIIRYYKGKQKEIILIPENLLLVCCYPMVHPFGDWNLSNKEKRDSLGRIASASNGNAFEEDGNKYALIVFKNIKSLEMMERINKMYDPREKDGPYTLKEIREGVCPELHWHMPQSEDATIFDFRRDLIPPTNEALCWVFKDYYVYDFYSTNNQQAVTNLLAGRNCEVIIPKSLRERVTLDFGNTKVYIDENH